MDDAVSDIISENRKGVESVPFVATPERVSGILDLETEQVHAAFKSVEGRSKLFNGLMEQQETIKKLHPDFHPEVLRAQLDSVGEALAAEERFLQQSRSPEKKSMFARAWETIVGFPRDYPALTLVLLVAALTSTAIYMGWIPSIGGWGKGIGDGWNNIMNWFKGGEAAEAAGEAVGAGGNAAAVEAAQAALPQTLDIYTVGHNIIYNGKTYTMEQFPEIFPGIMAEKGDKVLKVIRDASSRTTTENLIRDLFQQAGLGGGDYKWTDNFSNGAAD